MAGLLPVFATVAWGAPSSSGVVVRAIAYEGWSNALDIANGAVRVVVAPSVGRVVHYGPIGGANRLWLDPALRGAPGIAVAKRDGEDPPPARPIGGDTVWPMPRTGLPGAWEEPTDPWLDGTVHTARALDDGVELTGPVSPRSGVRIVREIRLAPQGSRVTIRQRLERRHDADLAAPRFVIWNVTRIPLPDELLFGPVDASAPAVPWRVLAGADGAASGMAIVNGAVAVTPRPGLIVAGRAGRWLAALDGDTVMAQVFVVDAAADYPDDGGTVETGVYGAAAGLGVRSPLHALAVGESMSFTIAWELFRLDAAATVEARRAAALAWLAGLAL